jgi:hypothetical protein
MLVSAAQGAADRRHVMLVVAPDAPSVVRECGAGSTRLVVIDLRTPSLGIAALVAEIRAASPAPVRILACGPHVHEASLAAATSAGCDAVITRGEFDRRIDAELARLTE